MLQSMSISILVCCNRLLLLALQEVIKNRQNVESYLYIALSSLGFIAKQIMSPLLATSLNINLKPAVGPKMGSVGDNTVFCKMITFLLSTI